MLSRFFMVIAGIFLLLIAYYTVMSLERYEEERNLGWRAAAIKNPYLATQLLAESSGYSAVAYDSFLKLGDLNQYDFIYIADSQLVLSPERIEALLAWVASGGHFMTGVTLNDNTDRDEFLNRLSLSLSDIDSTTLDDTALDGTALDETILHDSILDDTVRDSTSLDFNETEQSIDPNSIGDEQENSNNVLSEETPDDIANQVADDMRRYNESLKLESNESRTGQSDKLQSPSALITEREEAFADASLTRLHFGDNPKGLRIALGTEVDIYHPAMSDEQWNTDSYEIFYWQGTDSGIHFAQLDYGAGLISVATSSKLFDSYHIGLFDHAELWQVLSGNVSAIVYGSSMPSLWAIIWQAMPELATVLVLLLVLWLWSVAGYFGPKRQLHNYSRRAFHEHLDASAGYLWRHGYQHELLEPLRDEILMQATARLSQFSVADNPARVAQLAQYCELQPSLVEVALFSTQKFNEDAFTAIVQTLQVLKRKLR